MSFLFDIVEESVKAVEKARNENVRKYIFHLESWERFLYFLFEVKIAKYAIITA